jgi:Cu-Zn family superoxide dismutase
VHEKGDCSDIPGKSMGAHFALPGQSHGLPGADRHHLGDLGNIEISDEGEAALSITGLGATLIPGDSRSFLGKAIVIHEQRDQGTGESGESGRPIGCAIIASVNE